MSKKLPFKKITSEHGFTIIELIVSVALFIVVTLISVGALLNIVGVNKKAQSVKSVINNINFVMEGMSKNVRFGTTYHCESVVGGSVPPNLDTPKDCAVSSGNFFAYELTEGDRADLGDQVVYRLNGTQIEKSADGGSTFLGLTAPEVKISELSFFVKGAPAFDNLQPRVVIIVRGIVNFSERSKTEFNLQTTVSQREIDS